MKRNTPRPAAAKKPLPEPEPEEEEEESEEEEEDDEYEDDIEEEESVAFTRIVHKNGKQYVQIVWGDTIIQEKEIQHRIQEISKTLQETSINSTKKEEKKE